MNHWGQTILWWVLLALPGTLAHSNTENSGINTSGIASSEIKSTKTKSTEIKNAEIKSAEQTFLSILPKECNHSGEFSQKRWLPGLTTGLLSKGRFLFSCDRGLIWIVEEPVAEQILYRRNNKSIRLDEAGKSVKLNSRFDRALAKMLTVVLGGDMAYIEKMFAVRKHKQTFILSPQRRSMRKHLEHIQISQSGETAEIHIALKSGERLEMTLHKLAALSLLNQTLCITKHLAPTQICALAFGV